MVTLGLLRGGKQRWLLGGCGAALIHRGWSGNCEVYRALGIDTKCHPETTAVPAQQGSKVVKSFSVGRPAAELYGFWRQLENLPHIFQHLESVEIIDERHSQWRARGPLGMSLKWQAEIINDRPNEMIAWRSLPGADLDSAGSVHFTPLPEGRGTGVSLSLKYNPPAGPLGAQIASWLGSGLEQQVDQDLRHFKSFMEADEMPAAYSTTTRAGAKR